MEKKKLLVTASTFPRWEGDTEPRFVYDLSRAMLDEFDITVLVPAAPGALDREEMGGLHVERYHYFPVHKWETLCYPGAIVPRIKEKKARALLVPFLFLSLWWNLFKRRKRFDVVHAHWLIPQGIVQSFFKTPYLVTGHGGDVTSLNQGLLKALKRRCLQRAGAVTAVSPQLKQVLEEICPGKAVSVMPMGCDTKEFSPSHRKENFFGQNGKPVVLFVGRLAEKKGVTYLIEAMKRVDAQLVIVGDGPLRAQLEEQAKPLGDKVQFLGAKTHDQLAEIYASADVFAAPSVQAKDGDVEGFGLVFLEAMASGLPVVASRSGGIPYLVHDGENGLLVEPGNAEELAGAIERVLKNVNLRMILIKGGKETVGIYDYRTIGFRYGSLLEQIGTKNG